MATFTDKTFTDEPVVLDDNVYINCTFTRCDLHYAGGRTILDGCTFPTLPVLHLHRSALQTVLFLEQFGYRLQHPNGMESLKCVDDTRP